MRTLIQKRLSLVLPEDEWNRLSEEELSNLCDVAEDAIETAMDMLRGTLEGENKELSLEVND